MISGIKPEMIDYFLRPAEGPAEDGKTVRRIWIQNLLITGGVTAAAVIIFLVRLLVYGFFSKVMLFFLCFIVVFDIYVITKFIDIKVVRPKRYLKMVGRYGRENLVAQLSDTAAFGFFVDEDEYHNLTVLTLDYIMEHGEFVYALKDISSITLSKHDVTEEQITKFRSEHTRNVLRCAYNMEIILKDGRKLSELIGLLTTDINPFFGYLQQRAPHIKVQYR